MITLSDFLEMMETDVIRVNVPVTNHLTARIRVDTTDMAELDDLTRLYGCCKVRRFSPGVCAGRAQLDIDLDGGASTRPQPDGGE